MARLIYVLSRHLLSGESSLVASLSGPRRSSVRQHFVLLMVAVLPSKFQEMPSFIVLGLRIVDVTFYAGEILVYKHEHGVLQLDVESRNTAC